jgi:hypothetical protein
MPMRTADWHALSDDARLLLSREAVRAAAATIAAQAELLAEEIEAGLLSDPGGAHALRLLAATMRATGKEPAGPAGHA